MLHYDRCLDLLKNINYRVSKGGNVIKSFDTNLYWYIHVIEGRTYSAIPLYFIKGLPLFYSL